MHHKLVLWDIDRTLVYLGGINRAVYRWAYEQATGSPPKFLAPTTGRTEPQILMETLLLNGISASEATQLHAELLKLIEIGLVNRTGELRSEGRMLSGVEQALSTLADRDGVLQTVLTGSVKANAVQKVTIFGLDRFLDLDVGAYGSDDAYRPNLVNVARKRVYEKYRLQFAAAQTVVIGDSPLDVEAAKIGGARAVAVATGMTSASDLSAAGADVVLQDLTDIDHVINAVITMTSPPTA